MVTQTAVTAVTSTIPGIDDERAAVGLGMVNLALESEQLPRTFPSHLWHQQIERYNEYWAWFTGDKLNETQVGSTQAGEPILKFPLQMNSVRNFARKHASVLLGETDDTHHPMVKAIVQPKPQLGSDKPAEEDKKLAEFAQNILNEVWTASGGRALQYENAVLGQFLGGCVFKVTWQPWLKDDLQIPIVIEKVVPDHFIPVWNPKNYWDLLETFEIYRMPGAVARLKYGLDTEEMWVIYAEHWTKEKYTITIGGEPIKDDNGKVYKDVPNPWGVVPYAYIPSQRDGGSFWGASFVEDIRGLIKEFNARLADSGDAIRGSVHRRRYMRNVPGTTSEKQIANGAWATDLGTTPPGVTQSPEVYTEDPPNYPPKAFEFASTDLWTQLLREGDLQNVAFGEDEGSQRSALTLAFRWWPTTSKSRASRTQWTDGLNHIDRTILKIVFHSAKFLKISEEQFPKDFMKRLQISQDWHPMIPRDREQEVNEVILRHQAGLASPEWSLMRLGDVKDIPDELELIKDYLVFKSELAATPGDDEDGAGSGADGGVPKPEISNDTGTDD